MCLAGIWCLSVNVTPECHKTAPVKSERLCEQAAVGLEPLASAIRTPAQVHVESMDLRGS